MNIEKQIGAGLWRRTDLSENEKWEYRLSSSDHDELTKALKMCHGLPLEELTKTKFRLDNFAKRLAAMQKNLESGMGVMRLRGLAVKNFDSVELERLFYGLGSHLGTALSQSATGEKIYRVQDSGITMGHPKARGPNTRRALSFHTDRCDVIAFLCVRQAKSGGENLIASSKAVHNEILKRLPRLLDCLYQPFHYQRHNIDHGNTWPFCKQPIFSVFRGFFAANILRVLIDRAHSCDEIPDLTANQRAALDLLEEVARQPDIHYEFRQQPGDMLFINNFLVLHSRREFDDWLDPSQKRQLLRIWLSPPYSRPLDPAFSDHYGSTEPGSVRGGIHPLNIGEL
jgi:hypothetical protein